MRKGIKQNSKQMIRNSWELRLADWILLLLGCVVLKWGGGSFLDLTVETRGIGSAHPAGIPPALHFNTAVICRHRYLMKRTAVQEEKEAGVWQHGTGVRLAGSVIWNSPE